MLHLAVVRWSASSVHVEIVVNVKGLVAARGVDWDLSDHLGRHEVIRLMKSCSILVIVILLLRTAS